MNIGGRLLRKYGGLPDPDRDPGPPPPGSWVTATVVAVVGGAFVAGLLALAWQAQPASYLPLVIAGPCLLVSPFLRDRWGRRLVASSIAPRRRWLSWLADLDPPEREDSTPPAHVLGLLLVILAIGAVAVGMHWGWIPSRGLRRRW